MDKKPITRLCPIRGLPCLNEGCAWFEPSSQECAVLVLTSLLDELVRVLEE